MIKDLLISFTSTIKEKTQNPFLGTYFVVWLLRNWDLVFALFNFDQNYNLESKIAFVNGYYKVNSFTENILTNIGWTFLVLIITYLVLNLSRVIVNTSEKQIKPWIYKITDSKSTVLKSIHELVRNERDELQIRLDNEREAKSRLEIRIKNLEEEILEISKKRIENNVGENENKDSNKEFDEIELIYKKLEKENLVEEFINLSVKILKNNYIEDSYTLTDKFIRLGLIKFQSEHMSNYSKLFILTKEGENLLKYLRLK
jgi:hypothetical protein